MHEDIVDLQTRMSFQDGVIEQLNQVVTDQQQQIDRLERRMEKLLGQVEALQADQLIQQADEPPPPHY
ncbi:SlyX family protein [Methylophaga sp.]|jgi:SlyX protein|uniref:SlyX family protein n=1 Tax=Methylophaga sp. TaxID=2024840 RepID=UPI003A9122B2